MGALVLATSALGSPVPEAVADHLSSGCYDEHDGPHVFPVTDARVTIEFVAGPFAGQSDEVLLKGPTYVESTVASPTRLDTEIVKMDLVGASSAFGTVKVTENPVVASTGSVEPVGSSCFPSVSTFDVFVVIDFPTLGLLHNDAPVEMEAEITEVPPQQGAVYTNPEDPIPLFLGPPHDGPPPVSEDHVANIRHADHVPVPTPTPTPTVPLPPPPPPPPGVPATSGIGLGAAVLALAITGGVRLFRQRGYAPDHGTRPSG